MAIVGYVAQIREIEPGWGDRPDGFIVAETKEDINVFINREECFKPRNSEYSELVVIKFCEISELALKAIKESKNKLVWIHNKDFDNYILNV